MSLSKSKIFIVLMISWIFGIFLGFILKFNLLIFGIILMTFMAIIFLWHQDKLVKIAAFCGVALVLGVLRYQLSIPKISESNLQFYNDKGEVKLIGVVVTEPDIRKDKINLTVQGEQLVTDNLQQTTNNSVKGKVLVQVGRYPEYKYGDRLEISGNLKTPSEFPDFSYKDYLSRFQIYSVMYKPKVKFLAAGRGNFLYRTLFSIKRYSKYC